MRKYTRKERIEKKRGEAVTLPVSFVTINFRCDENVAFTIRTAACFGAEYVAIIGHLPPRSALKNSSGSTIDYMKILQFSNPEDYLAFAREQNIKVVAAELTENATSLYQYKFQFEQHTALILGHETVGVPAVFTLKHDTVYIPMPGYGWCLNTSQTGTAMLSEYTRQYADAHGLV